MVTPLNTDTKQNLNVMGNMACILKDYTKDYYEKAHTHSVKVLSMFSRYFFVYNELRINIYASLILSRTLFYYENIVTGTRFFSDWCRGSVGAIAGLFLANSIFLQVED
jgi:hypothetical protein